MKNRNVERPRAQRRNTWRNWILGVTATVVGGVLLQLIFVGSEWDFWDRFTPREPVDRPVALTLPLKHDPSGAHTAEIRRSLDNAGLNYRIIDRDFPRLGAVVPSDSRDTELVEQGQRLLQDHGGDVIIFGSVTPDENTIHIRFFGFGHGAFVEDLLTATLSDDTWRDEFAFVVQAMMTESALDQFIGPRGLQNKRRGAEGLMDAVQKKLTTIRQVSRDEFLMERAGLGIRLVEIARAKLADDLETVRRLKLEIESDVGKHPRPDDSPYHKALRLQLADLYMIEGLMAGTPDTIDEGMRIAMATGKQVMRTAMIEDGTIVQEPESSHWVHWFLMTALVLACDDKQMMWRLEELMRRSVDSLADTADMHFADYMGMLIPLSHVNRLEREEQLRDVHEYLTSLDGVKNLPRWQDPFTHALRLLERRLSDADPASSTQCPSLQPWMRVKGWLPPQNEPTLDQQPGQS